MLVAKNYFSFFGMLAFSVNSLILAFYSLVKTLKEHKKIEKLNLLTRRKNETKTDNSN